MTKETIPDLAFDIDGDTIDLEQDAGCGEVNRVILHRTQVLYMAQRMGLVREMSASEADNHRTPGEMARSLDSIKRNMLRVRAYALDLQDDFRNNADWKHSDLTHEMTRINALVDLLDMAVDDFVDDFDAIPPASPPEVVTVTTGGEVPGRAKPKLKQPELEGMQA